MSNIKNPYGLKNGVIVSIDQVDRGLACGCICPNCKSTFIARKGSNTHHFSHYKSPDCGWTGETIIHKFAKEIISNSKKIKLPKVYWKHKSKIIIYHSRTIKIDNVRYEKKYSDIRPDIIIESQGRELLVEIKVTHGIDYDKYQKIKRLNISCFEIDVKNLVNWLFDKNDYFLKDEIFKNELLSGIEQKYWIYNTKKDRINYILKRNYSKKFKIQELDSKSWEFSSFSYINNCPIGIRKWKSGYKEGKSYAKVKDDCKKCMYFLDNDLLNVYCVGHLGIEKGNKLRKIIREIR